MATVNKDFKIKSGLIVEGTNGTINGYDILTKDTASTQFIIDTVGGSATSTNTPDTVVLRDGNGDFAAGTITADLVGNVTGDVSGNAGTATALETARTIQLTGDVTGSVSFDGTANVQISTTLGTSFATDAEVATAKGEAIDAAATYTDGEISTALTTAQGYANTAENNAKTYADGVAATAEDNANSYTDTAINNLNLAGTYDALGAADQALTDAKAYTDQEVAALVDGAPALLDTLNELAAAIADNPNYATDVANLVAGKQDALTAGEGIYIDGNNVITGRQQSGGGLKFVNNEAAIDRTTVDGWYDAAGAATTAENNAKSYADDVAFTAEGNAKTYADGLAVNYDPAGAATTAENNAKTYTDGEISTALTTAQGYANTAEANANDYTDTSIANLNLGTTYDAYGAAAQAESNANAYTDDKIANGDSTASPTYQALNVTWVRKEEATWTNVPTASTAVAHMFSTMEGSVKYLVRVYNNGKSQVSEILATTDSSNNVAIVEYGTVYTSDNPLATATVEWNAPAAVYELKVTTANNASEILVAATMIAQND